MPHNEKLKRVQGQRVSSDTRSRFLSAYERNFGNVSLTCREVGIHRRTYYRWLASPTEVNEKFRKALERLKPEEYRIDMLEAAHTELVKKLDTAAVIYGLKTKGRQRGWNEREVGASSTSETPSDLNRLIWLIRERAQQQEISYAEELEVYLSLFGRMLAPTVAEGLREELESAGGPGGR